MAIDVGDLRRNYEQGALDLEALNPDPIKQFESWFKEAREAGVHEPNAMSLSTASKDAVPTVRTVLLKSFDHDGFTFFTNYFSTKAAQIEENPQASLLFPWLTMERQVLVHGTVTKVSREESAAYFASRPRGSQLGAWVSKQSSIVTTRKELENKLEELESTYADRDVPLPDFWGGFLVKPDSIEFWQGRPNRLHDRLVYQRGEGECWGITRLSP